MSNDAFNLCLERVEDEDGWRFYRPIGDEDRSRWYISVTEVLKPILAQRLQQWIKTTSAKKQDAILNEASDVGTELHSLVESDLLGKTPTVKPQYEGFFEKWKTLRQEHGINAEKHEAYVCSDRYGYAGTFDILGMFNGKRAIMDVKTGFYGVKTGWQLAAYRNAYKELTGEDVGLVGLSIRKDGSGAQAFEYEHLDFCWVTFLAALQVFRALYWTKLSKMQWHWLETPYVEEKIRVEDFTPLL